MKNYGDYTLFKGTALNCGKAISGLSKRDIGLIGIKADGGYIYFKAKSKDNQKIIAFFDEICYTYQIIGESGFFRRLRLFFKRKGLVAGVLIVAILFGLINSRLNDIKISGLKTVEYSAVEEILLAQGIKKGVSTRKIDKKHLEYLITSSIDGVAFASIRVSGMTLFINIYEELPPPDIVDMTDDVPLLAKKDGIVTHVIVFSGTPLVKPGDPVVAGETLVAPVENSGGVPVGVRAVGEVFAKVYYSGNAVFLENQVVLSRTGKTKTLTEVEIFGLPIGKKPSPPFALYDEETRTQYSAGPAPIKTVTRKYYELTASIVKRSFLQEFESLIKRAEANAKSKIPDGAVILDGWYRIKENADGNGGRLVEYYYEAEERIS
ncbi:MAG: sporulation protein YqfD [Clostridiales bacterium]|nr:sporulation protein YqfD [Clostridiales bacterium]